MRPLPSLGLLPLVACGWFVSSTPPPPPPAVVVVPRIAPAPTDVESTGRGSPAGSLAQRPPWRNADLGYAPTMSESDAAPLFAAGTTQAEDRPSLAGDLLACRIDVKFEEIKSWSLRPHKWAAADLLIAIGFGPSGATEPGRIVTSGTNQSNHAHFVVPAARLAANEVVDIIVNDRDRLLGRDFIDRIPLLFAGSTPLLATGAVSAVVCRVVDTAALGPFVHTRLWDVDDAFAQWRVGKPDIGSGTATCAAPAAVTDALAHLAAMLGWDDPRVVARLDRAASTEVAVMQACAERYAAFVGGLESVGVPATLAGTDIGVRVLDGSCGAAAMARLEATSGRSAGSTCMFALEITNRASVPLMLPTGARLHAEWEVGAFDARGRELATSGPATAPPPIAGGATRRAELGTGKATTSALTFSAAPVLGVAPPVMIELRERAGAARRIRLRLPRIDVPR